VKTPFRTLLFGISVLFCAVYIPFIWRANFSGDAWWMVARGGAFGSWPAAIKYWFGTIGFRPVNAAFVILTARFISSPMAWALLNMLLWAAFVVIFSVIVARKGGGRVALLFLVFVLFPTMSSSVVYRFMDQTAATLALLLWGLSLFFCDACLQTNKFRHAILSFIFLLASLLCYESPLPLFCYSALYPLVFYGEKTWELDRKKAWKKVAGWSGSVLGVVLIIVLYQHMVAPTFAFEAGKEIAKVEHRSLFAYASSFADWGLATFAGYPVLIFNSVRYAFRESPAMLFLLGCLFGFNTWFFNRIGCSASLHERKECSNWQKRKGVGLLIIAFISCPVIFVLSGYSARVDTPLNRLMIATWITSCLILAALVSKFLKYRWVRIFVSAYLAVSIFSFIITLQQCVVAGRLQQVVIEDCLKKMEEAGAPADAYVLGNVPRYLMNNHANEPVFEEAPSFGYALIYISTGLVKGGIALNDIQLADRLAPAEFKYKKHSKVFVGPERVVVQDYHSYSYTNLWYYEYDQLNGSSTLKKMASAEDARALLTQKNKINTYPLPASQQVRDFMKSLMQHNKESL
jgi:hypothetical protein